MRIMLESMGLFLWSEAYLCNSVYMYLHVDIMILPESVACRCYPLFFKWLNISLPVYPELVAAVGSRVPDYRGRFLRGVSSGHSIGEKVANSLKSHNHTQPTHTHSFSGQLVSTALSGTAAGQRYLDAHTSLNVNSLSGATFSAGFIAGAYGPDITTVHRILYAGLDTRNTRTAQSSSVSGNLRNGTVSGSIGAGGGNPTDYTGDSETAPDHIYVRCLIRAHP